MTLHNYLMRLVWMVLVSVCSSDVDNLHAHGRFEKPQRELPENMKTFALFVGTKADLTIMRMWQVP